MGADDFAYFFLVQIFSMLGRDNNRSGAHRLAVHIFKADLGFRIRTEPGGSARMARLGQGFQDFMGKVNGSRHQNIGLAAGVTEHDALVAGALILVAGGIDADGDIRRLSVNMVFEFQVLPVKTFLLVSDVADRRPGNVLDPLGGYRIGAAHFAGDDQKIGRAKGLNRHPGEGIGSKISIDDGIGNTV